MLVYDLFDWIPFVLILSHCFTSLGGFVVQRAAVSSIHASAFSKILSACNSYQLA